MSKFAKYSGIFIPMVAILLLLSSCDKFFNPAQELKITEDKLFDDWYEFRAIEMGMYGLQQNLVEQLVVLGELRADMVTITPNADADLVEIYNWNFSKDNKYASPTNFFKLISACNNFIRVLEREHPEVADPSISLTTNYDKLYGEALCMRAWAYFNAVRIYGKVPYIEESLVTMNEIEEFVNTPGTYIDSVYVDYATDGYYNDTIYNHPITMEKQLLDMEMVIDMFTNQLEKDVKAVGVNHAIDNNDEEWELVTWNTWAWHALLGQLYLYQGDLAKAAYHYEEIIYTSQENRYQLTATQWYSLFQIRDRMEHIYLIWFDKENFQQNALQRLFDNTLPNEYMLKPTKQAVMMWETQWYGFSVDNSNGDDHARVVGQSLEFPQGVPHDPRGPGVSYIYKKGTEPNDWQNYTNNLSSEQVAYMCADKAVGDFRSVYTLMEGYDTLVWKYAFAKGAYQQDADFCVYRAGGIHLNLAEIYTYWVYDRGGGFIGSYTNNALNILNDGSNYSDLPSRLQRGVRGRANREPVTLYNIIYIHDPITNEVLGYHDYTGNLDAKKRYLDEKILLERGLELGFEGERFYDIMRLAKRYNDPSFLAEKVAAKYPSAKRQEIYNFLLDENNWYIHMFD
ncbi:MAG: RagB/SusD family nutrient uptake outer membrane protein [Mariniphaga sp.]|nr:RagB/SusD family nutrient uptake outer membrane protein [Mariniphaga sp.]